MTLKLLVPLLTLSLTASAARADEPPSAERQRFARQQQMLSRLWVFATLNYLYCDVISLMDANMLKQYGEGEVEGLTIDENFLLGATILMQVPLSMVFLSTELGPKASRIANIAAGSLMTSVQAATLFMGKPTKYYAFSSAVEIATTGFITAYAIFAMKPPRLVPSVEAGKDSFAMKVGFTF
jgi:hypothetical protein